MNLPAENDNLSTTQDEEIKRPHAWVKSLRFSDSTELEFGKNEIVVFVGANNSGKTQTLDDIFSLIGSPDHDTPVVKEITFDTEGTPEGLRQWADENYKRTESPDRIYKTPTGNLHSNHFRRWPNAHAKGFGELQSFVASYIRTQDRLAATDPAPVIDFLQETPTHPIQVLHENDDLASRFDGIFHDAFGQNLIVNHAAGNNIPLHVGERPTLAGGEDRVSTSYQEKLRKLPLINRQGDGMRSFVGVLLKTLVSEKSITLIDEPDAFLHPPQAIKLGRLLATECPENHQLFISTHSTDFLKGILDARVRPIRVIRIDREQDINKISELSPQEVNEVWSDSLLRYSKVLDGLFHEGVIVCEGDSDCRFFNAVMDSIDFDSKKPDLHFVHGGGKSRIPVIVEALKALKVPVRVVSDIDLFNDTNTGKKIVEALDAKWNEEIESSWTNVKNSIDSKRPELPKDDAKESINGVLNRAERALSDEDIRDIKSILKKASPWSEAKQNGKSFIPNGQQTETYEQLNIKLHKIGLFVLEVGELEGFHPSIGNHGPRWVSEVLERDIATDPKLEEARKFVKTLMSDW